MKKLLSIVLAVAMMSVMAFSASAADIDVLAKCEEGKIYANNTDYATMTVKDDGSYEVVVTEGASADLSAAYGMAIEPFMTGVDLNATPYMIVNMTCDAPFRITLLDKNAAGDQKWISFGSEFFNTFVADGQEAPGGAPENNFFPAGTYNCYAFLKGYYDWKTNNENLEGYDPASANITAIYIELLEPGTLNVSKLALAASETGDGSEGGDDSKDEDTKATTTTKKNANKDDSTDSAKTGDVSEAIVFAAAAIVAGAVVTMTVIASKKAKSR